MFFRISTKIVRVPKIICKKPFSHSIMLTTSPNTQNILTQVQQQMQHFQQTQGTYSAEIKRDQPTAILLLIDQSGSMNSNQKAQNCADAVNNLLNEVINISIKEDGLRDYIDVAVIGYGAEKDAQFLLEDGFMSLTQLTQNYISTTQKDFSKEIRGKISTETKTVKVWLNAVAKNATPMGNAFEKAFEVLEMWIKKNPNSFPPVVINVSDGEATDSTNDQMLEKAFNIKNLTTTDGQVLLFNCHLANEAQKAIIFPKNRQELPQNDKFALLMYDMSSNIPAKMHKKIANLIQEDIPENTQIVAMGYNADGNSFVKLLEVGTRTQFTAIAGKN